MNIHRGAATPAHGTSGGNLKVLTQSLDLATQGDGQMIDLTPDASRLLASAGMQEGQVTIFVPGSTASVTTIEFEPGLKKDFPNALEHIAPADAEYEHDNTWHDGNGHSHVRASLVGPSLVVPFLKGRLLLGTWQQIVLVDWDNRARRREIIFQFIGQT
jgi:secondary thiamine-phosphate synthase enzyme